jgi:hypothetical protein
MILLSETNINDVDLLSNLIFKFKLPLFNNQTIFWSEDDYIKFVFEIYIKPINCPNSNSHVLDKISIHPKREYIQPLIQNNIEYTESNNFFGIDKELLFEYYVCDQDTYLNNFYFLDKSHITYSINIKAYLLNIDDILIYNLCKHNDKKLKEVFNNYEYNASFFYEENNNKKRKYDEMLDGQLDDNQQPIKKYHLTQLKLN